MPTKEWFQSVLDEAARCGFRTTPVFKDRSVKPFAGGQDYKNISDYQGAIHVAVVLDDVLLLDRDAYKGDTISLTDLEEAIDIFEMPPPVQTHPDKDSQHFMFSLRHLNGTGDSLLQSNVGKTWKNIDLLRGNQVMHVKPGKKLALVPKAQLIEARPALIDALKSGQDDEPMSDLDELVANQPLDLSDAKVDGLLDAYPAEGLDYDQWLEVGQALHHQTEGEGFDLWLTWSEQSSKHDDRDMSRKWQSFGAGKGRKPKTLATIIKRVKDSGGVVVVPTDDIKSRIASAEATELKQTLIPEIRGMGLDRLGLEGIAKAVQARLKEVDGATVPIGAVRKELKPVVERNRPAWCDDWLYVNSHQSFFSIKGRSHYKSEAFNLACGHQVPEGEEGGRQSAVRFVSEGGYIEIVEGMVYMPGTTDAVCRMPGGTALMANTFNPASVPKAATSRDEAAEAVIKRHLRVLTGNDEDADILLQWLAYNVQNPGVKLLWAPLIQSIQGVGKGVMRDLLYALLGMDNVGIVSPQVVMETKYNSYAIGKMINIIEEMRIAGHNRHEVSNALKPLITDPVVSISEKYVRSYNTINTVNYIAFTNEKDAIPLEETDRRWWVIFCPLLDLEHIGREFGMTKSQYLDELFGTIRSKGSELRRWLLDYEVSAEFLSWKQAPMTAHKQAMIATEKGSVEWLAEVEEIIEKGGKFYGYLCVSSSHLFTACELEIDGFDANKFEKNKILKKLGYQQHPRTVKIDGEVLRVWTKRTMSNEEIREIYKEPPF
jgi:hypothetical protein